MITKGDLKNAGQQKRPRNGNLKMGDNEKDGGVTVETPNTRSVRDGQKTVMLSKIEDM